MKEHGEFLLKFSFPIFILLGLAKTSTYYNQFHLPILEYLSFSEMITIFLNNLYIYFSLAFHLAIFFLLDKKHFRGSISLIFIGSALVTTYNSFAGNFSHDTSNILIVLTGIIIFASVVFAISKTKIYEYLSTLDETTKKYFAATFAMLSLLVISSFQGKFEADQVKEEHIYSGTSIHLENQNIISNNDFYFIGKTSEFIFFFNQKGKYVRAYPINSVSEITYKSKARY